MSWVLGAVIGLMKLQQLLCLVCECQKVGKEGNCWIRRGTGFPLSKSRKAVWQGGGKVSKLLCARTVALVYLNLSWRFSLFCVALLLVCLDGLGKEEELSFSETLSNGMASVIDFVMLSPLFLCAPTADCAVM